MLNIEFWSRLGLQNMVVLGVEIMLDHQNMVVLGEEQIGKSRLGDTMEEDVDHYLLDGVGRGSFGRVGSKRRSNLNFARINTNASVH